MRKREGEREKKGSYQNLSQGKPDNICYFSQYPRACNQQG